MIDAERLVEICRSQAERLYPSDAEAAQRTVYEVQLLRTMVRQLATKVNHEQRTA